MWNSEAQLKLVAQLRDELRIKTIKNQMLKFLVGIEPGSLPIDHDVKVEKLDEMWDANLWDAKNHFLIWLFPDFSIK